MATVSTADQQEIAVAASPADAFLSPRACFSRVPRRPDFAEKLRIEQI